MASSSVVTKAKPTTTLRVAAFSGSLRKGSWYAGLIRAAEELCEESIPGMLIDHVDISGLPMSNPDLESKDGDDFPPDVEAFRVRAVDCFLFASPEHNYFVTPTLKNALDWASRGKHKCWADKAVAIVSAGGSWGGGRAAFHLRQIRAYEDTPKFDADGNLVDAETRERLKQVLLSLQAFARRLQRKED